MTEALKARIEALRDEIDNTEGTARAEALDHLEQAVRQLEGRGARAPVWARDRVEAHRDEDLEDQFDNMPI
ncbi:MAG: hypothetical protein ACU0CC_15085 [Sagittula sp.]|jgi:transcription elongation GreA/GreB family factor|uniref:hypothetical protein n=1 Tax=unclassified Sagittula TaxID=2624628 RepID=UPI000C2CEA47|nr:MULTISPECIES: hypothetical protein [unclassified Sagittula]AUC52340.1 hypothetical protein CDO87_03660 [Sagittula sp. P11]WHZ36428.1 hypothetical protein QNI11_05305 [Sagittula sp. MA-2]